MAGNARFNRRLLLGAQKQASSRQDFHKYPYTFSRRAFLSLSGATAALTLTPPLLRAEGFSIVRDGQRLHVLLGQEPRWTIDPEVFGGVGGAQFEHREGTIQLGLRGGYLPGTEIPADFTCVLGKTKSAWQLRIRMDCGIEATGDLLQWLEGRVSLQGVWRRQTLRPFSGFTVEFDSCPAIAFTPDWRFELTGESRIKVEGLTHTLGADRATLRVNHTQRISSAEGGYATEFSVPREERLWSINLSRVSPRGWALSQERVGKTFDELRVEAVHLIEGGGRRVRNAMLLAETENESALKLHTGGELLTDSGEPFYIELHGPRLAFSLNEEKLSSSLVAEIDDKAVWAHGREISMLFARSEEDRYFELHESEEVDSEPQVGASLCQICFPGEDTCTTLKLGSPRHIPFTWEDLVAPFERMFGWLHLLPSQHPETLKPLLLEPEDVLQIDRPRDMVSLAFSFANMRLRSGIHPRLEPVGKPEDARITVTFLPQHIAEEAYFHTGEAACRSSSIAFRVPLGDQEIRQILGKKDTDPIQQGDLEGWHAVVDGRHQFFSSSFSRKARQYAHNVD